MVCLDRADLLRLNCTMEPDLRERIGREEFDYSALMSTLSGYANPRDKVTSLLRRGVIVRVKKGLHVFGDADRRRPYSRELLANLIYGPSFVSLDYALAFHGLIPERVGFRGPGAGTLDARLRGRPEGPGTDPGTEPHPGPDRPPMLGRLVPAQRTGGVLLTAVQGAVLCESCVRKARETQ